ncbi:MAG: ankyrin repeat domain-containing protein [Rickettsiales bacterium]|jgi:hypothetical protein|nr:ankyrin repeat domain-containing protein [Rickettsiales bacterium]MDR1261553.1 ankyrin repeat domain-containing protein [Rickettsiales bacterium]
MAYSDDDVRELYRKIATIIQYDNKGTASLKDLLKKSKWEEVNFQGKCEGDNSLGDLLLKHAAENGNSRVKSFLLNNGFTLPQQEQITAAVNEEEEQKTPDVEENKAETSLADSNNPRDIEFTLSYDKVKEIVINNPNITAEEFGKELKRIGKTDAKICDLFMDVIRSRGADISNDRDTFLKTIALLVKSNIKIDIGDTASNTVLDYAVVGRQPDVIKMLLGSDKFNPEKKLHALNSAIAQGNVQEFEVFLNYLNHESILEVLNTSYRNESTDIMKVLLDNKRFTEEEKANALSGAFIDGGLPKVRLLLKYMTGIPASGIRSLLEIIEESKSPFEEELKINSEFKVNFSNADHCKYLSNRVIIALLRSAINNIPDVEENGAESSRNGGNSVGTGQTAVLDSDSTEDLCEKIERTIACAISYGGKVPDLGNLKNRLKEDFNLQDKGNALLEQAVKKERLNVIKFLLRNGVTIINTTGQEESYYISKIKENESILCSVVSYTNGDNDKILSTLLQNINAKQSKLDHESALYRLYQQLKDDAFCTAFEKRNSVAATVLIQSDQERIAPCESATNKRQETSHIETNSASSNSRNADSRPTATLPPISTNEIPKLLLHQT